MRIFYYNIDYICNNKCLFCISHSVDNFSREMNIQHLLSTLHKEEPTSEDFIIINGGEPTIHSQFYELINQFSGIPAVVKIYSNGVKIDASKLKNHEIEFIIPIHGCAEVHDGLTRVKGAYENTINSLKKLQKEGIPYNLKFIISREMIASGFNICDFISRYDFNPKEIFLCRMNDTKKGSLNHFLLPDKERVRNYLNLQISELENNYPLKLLDFSFCYLNEEYQNLFEKNDLPEAVFFYNDDRFDMMQQIYRKEKVETKECKKCRFFKECQIMFESYFLLKLSQDKKLFMELE